MDAAGIIDTLTPLVPGASFEAVASVDFPTIYVPPDRLVDTCRALRDTPSLRFEVIIEITAAARKPRRSSKRWHAARMLHSTNWST